MQHGQEQKVDFLAPRMEQLVGSNFVKLLYYIKKRFDLVLITNVNYRQ